jgi:hypothetical protein
MSQSNQEQTARRFSSSNLKTASEAPRRPPFSPGFECELPSDVRTELGSPPRCAGEKEKEWIIGRRPLGQFPERLLRPTQLQSPIPPPSNRGGSPVREPGSNFFWWLVAFILAVVGMVALLCTVAERGQSSFPFSRTRGKEGSVTPNPKNS